MFDSDNLDLFKNDFSQGFLSDGIFKDQDPFNFLEEEDTKKIENPFNDLIKKDSNSYPILQIDEGFLLDNKFLDNSNSKKSKDNSDNFSLKINNDLYNTSGSSPIIKENLNTIGNKYLSCKLEFNDNKENKFFESIDKKFIDTNFDYNEFHQKGSLKNYLIRSTLLYENEEDINKLKMEKLFRLSNINDNDYNNSIIYSLKNKFLIKRKNAKLLQNKKERIYNFDCDYSEENEIIKNHNDLILNSDKHLVDKQNIIDEGKIENEFKNKEKVFKELIDKKELRKMKNREAAVKSRLNKKLICQNLNDINDKLAEENHFYRNLINEITKNCNDLCSKCKAKFNLPIFLTEENPVYSSNNPNDKLDSKQKNETNKNKIRKKIKIDDIDNSINNNLVTNSYGNRKKMSIATGFLLIVCIIGTLLNSYSTTYADNSESREGNTLDKIRILRNVDENTKFNSYPIESSFYTLNINNENFDEKYKNQNNKYYSNLNYVQKQINASFSNEINHKNISNDNIVDREIIRNFTLNIENENKLNSINEETRFLAVSNEKSNMNKISLKPNIIHELISKNNFYKSEKERKISLSNNRDKIKNDNFYNLVFTSLKCNESKYERDLNQSTKEKEKDTKQIDKNKKLNPILFSVENPNQPIGNLKSSLMQKLNSEINPIKLVLNSTEKISQKLTNNYKPFTVSLPKYNSNESCINNPSFLKFMENSKLNYADNDKIYNNINNIDDISDYYTKNLNLSSEEKLNIKNCIVMQIINSSTTTLNLGDIGTINQKQYDSKQIFTIQEDVYLKIVISADNIYDNIKSNLKDFKLSNFTLLDSVIKKDIFNNYRDNQSKKLYFVIKCQIKDLKLLNFSA